MAMPRLAETFKRLRDQNKTGLVTYVTAGDPDLPTSAAILQRLDRAGADVLEVGVPFSDPLADGPVIQRATERALAHGTTLSGVLDMIGQVRSSIDAPIVIFSYVNPILRMGLETFAAHASAAGVDGVLALDLPPEEAEVLRGTLTDSGIDTIFLLSPTTSSERIRRAAALGSGFLYGISRLGVTGVRDTIDGTAADLSTRVRAETGMPLALGFGLSSPEHVRSIGRLADAAVVGSALVNVIATHGQSSALLDEVERYVRWLQS
jgi:tryptophan synthase alpha chain